MTRWPCKCDDTICTCEWSVNRARPSDRPSRIQDTMWQAYDAEYRPLSVDHVRTANPKALSDCGLCHGLGTVYLSGREDAVVCREPRCPALQRARDRIYG